MLRHYKPILLAIVVVALAVAIWGYPTLLGGKKVALTTQVADPSTVAYSNADDNESEDLIIRSDKKVYEGFSGSTIYFSVDPLEKKRENVGLQFYFTDTKAAVVHVYKYQKKDHYWLELSLDSGAIAGASYYADAMARRKIIDGKAYVQSNVSYDSSGETEYFMAEISYNPGTPGQLLIEGFGSGGSYGILDPWYSSGWAYRKKITVNPQYVKGAAGRSNFPMLFSRTDPDLKYTASGGHVASSTGGEILFTDEAGNKLSHEIEKYASTTGELVAWVKVPFISSTSTRDFYIYYGNATVPLANQQDATNVWDTNYKGVWHLPNGNQLTANDSTTNGGNASTLGSATPATGLMDGGAANNNRANALIDIPDSSAVDLAGTSLTVSVWVKPTSTKQTTFARLVARATTCGCDPFMTYGLNRLYDSEQVEWNISTGGGGSRIVIDGGALEGGKWSYVVGTYNGATSILYVDGVEVVRTSTTLTIGGETTPLGIGYDTQFLDEAIDGTLDEVRISNSARNATYIATEYFNQVSPNSFYSYSGEGVEIRSTAVAGVKVHGGVKVRGGVKFR